MRNYHLYRRYGLGAGEVEQLAESQAGLCGICQQDPASQVDHDHMTRRVRGLLCDGCNGGLGAFQDDPTLIQAAIDYLRRWA